MKQLHPIAGQSLDCLDSLIGVCEDGRAGYERAARLATSPALKSAFHRYAQQRAQFAGDLRNETRRLGGDPRHTGTLPGALHRMWFDMRTTLSATDDNAVVAECERGEDHAMEAYQLALGRPIDPLLRSMIGRQYADVQRAHDDIHSLQVQARRA